MQLPAIAPSIRQAYPEERTAVDAASVQLQVFHEELEPERFNKCTCSGFHAKCTDTAIISGHLMCAAADVIPLSCLACEPR